MFGRAVREGTVHELQFGQANAAAGLENDDLRENGNTTGDDQQGREEPGDERERKEGRVGGQGDEQGEGTGKADRGAEANKPQGQVAVEGEDLPFPVQETGDGTVPSD